MPKRDKLTPLQEEFVYFYFMKSYVNDAAESVGISERTARRWFALPLVRQAIEAKRQERREEVQRKMNECMDLAIDYLHDMLHSAVYPKWAESHHVEPERVDKYIALLFKHASDQHEIDALKKRVAELEARVDVQEVQEPIVEGRLLRRID